MSSVKSRGFLSLITMIILAIIALALLKFFLNWDIFDAAATDQGKSTITYVRDLVNLIWSYIGTPLSFIWERICVPIFRLAWDNFQNIYEKGRGLDIQPISIPS